MATPLTFPSDLTVDSNRYGNNRLCINIFKNNSTPGAAIASAIATDITGAITTALALNATLATMAATVATPIPKSIAASRRSKLYAEASEYTIFLPIPMALDTNYSIDYSEVSVTDLGASIIAGGLSAVQKGLAAASKAPGKIGPSAGAAGAVLSTVTGDGAKSALKLLGLQAGLSLNPHQELLLNGVKFREFKFSYDLIAKNKDDSDAIKEIIKALKISMHPEVTDSTLLFKYPSEFELLFYTTNTTQNPYLFKTKRCILKDLQVSYGKNFVTFKDTNAPVEISITMNFQETEILDRGAILADATGVTF